MTELKFEILETLYNSKDRSKDYNELLNSFKGRINTAKQDVSSFISAEYIIKTQNTLKLTFKGEDLYERTLEFKQEKELLRIQNKHNRTIAIISVVAASIAALVPFLDFILSLFEIALR
jgi:Mg2+ and Co2+ transporter CorA